jgi:hypothetical protein
VNGKQKEGIFVLCSVVLMVMMMMMREGERKLDIEALFCTQIRFSLAFAFTCFLFTRSKNSFIPLNLAEMAIQLVFLSLYKQN